MTAVLEARGLTRRFGGLTAVSDISLTLRPGALHAVIGPNGAGKSTLINLLSGALRPDTGTLHLNGVAIGALPDWRRARAGIGRSFQRGSFFPAMTVRENLRLAAQGKVRGWGLLAKADGDRRTRALAAAALEEIGLAAHGEVLACVLSHGQTRLLEIGLAVAAEPPVLLLDEPFSGLGADETAPVAGLLRRLATDRTILLVEHDMDAVFALAAEITVMVDGLMLETGPPDAIRASAAVRDAYLGHRT